MHFAIFFIAEDQLSYLKAIFRDLGGSDENDDDDFEGSGSPDDDDDLYPGGTGSPDDLYPGGTGSPDDLYPGGTGSVDYLPKRTILKEDGVFSEDDDEFSEN